VPLHVSLPTADEGEFVGYFSAVEGDFSESGDGYGSGLANGGAMLFLKDGDQGNVQGVAALNESDPDILTYVTFNPDGTPIEGNVYSSEGNYNRNDEDGSASSRTSVYIDNEGYGDHFYHSESRYDNGYGEAPAGNSSESISGGSVYVYQEVEQGEPAVESEPQPPQLLQDYWAGTTYGYQYNGEISLSNNGAFVAGVTTPLADLDQLIAGDVVAAYSGDTMMGRQSVRMEVDFGAERFTSEFGDVDEFEKTYKYGIDPEVDLSFTASGVIEGVNLISDEISADAGYVQGTFFGAGAEIIGGTIDVTIDDNRIVDVFTAVEGENNRIISGPPR